MKNSVIAIDPEIMSGAPCFAGTRVPVQTLFDYLGGGHPLADFLDDFPTVTEAQVRQFLGDEDYAKREYGVTDEELDAFVKRMDEEFARDRKAGTFKRFTGNFEADIRN